MTCIKIILYRLYQNQEGQDTILYLKTTQQKKKGKTMADEYNDIPVLYCKHCLSLLVKNDEFVGDYCAECGSTDIEETHIENWEILYQKKYKKKC